MIELLPLVSKVTDVCRWIITQNPKEIKTNSFSFQQLTKYVLALNLKHC